MTVRDRLSHCVRRSFVMSAECAVLGFLCMLALCNLLASRLKESVAAAHTLRRVYELAAISDSGAWVL